MATATADRLEDTIAGDDYGQALGEGEITRILKTVQAAQFKKSETFTAEDTAFKPRSLVEIAFAAEQKRQQEEQAARAAEQAAAAAAAVQAATTAAAAEAGLSEHLPAGPADNVQPDSTGPIPQDVPHQAVPAQQTDAEAAFEPAAAAAPDIEAELMQAKAQQAEEEARRQRELDDQALRQEAEEQGYKRGFEAGLEAARTAEPTAEELALQAEKEAEKQAIVAKFHDAIAALASPQALDSSALSKAINDAVLQLAAERAGQVIQENPEGFLRRIRQLVDRVKSASQQVEVFVNHADLDVLNKWMQDHTVPSGWQFTADAQLDHGDIRLLLGGIEITDILNPVSVTPEENPSAPMADAAAEAPVDKQEDISVSEPESADVTPEENLSAPVADAAAEALVDKQEDTSVSEPESADIPSEDKIQPEAESDKSSEAEQLTAEADMDKADAPLSEQISAPAAEAASDSAGEQTDDQSLERDSE